MSSQSGGIAEHGEGMVALVRTGEVHGVVHGGYDFRVYVRGLCGDHHVSTAVSRENRTDGP